MRKHIEQPLLLHGKVVLPDGNASPQYVSVENGEIVRLAATRPHVPDGTIEVELDDDDWVFPGLLDLHTHADYNILPIWESPVAPFDNRFGWRSDPGYKRLVRGLHQSLVDSDKRVKLIIEVFAELQAVAGGTTVLQESYPLDEHEAGERLLLCRDTADPEDIFLPSGQTVMSVVDFWRPHKETGEPELAWNEYRNTTYLDAYLDDRDHGKLAAALVHLAEGRSGFGRGMQCDPYSRREFELLMDNRRMADAESVKAGPLTLIHGSGIDAHNPQHLEFLVERDISVVWSPVSNLLLYGDTLDVEAFLDAGVNVALGSDWSPSGSKHVWDEARFARFYLDAVGAQVSDAQIFEMVTVNAARCLGSARLGRIAQAGPADFFIVRSRLETDSAMEVFLATTDRHVRAVVVAGRPIYGDAELLGSFGVETQPLPQVEGTAARNKAVHLPPGVKVNLTEDLQQVETFLKQRGVLRSNTLASSDVHYGRRIAELKAYTARFGWSASRFKHELWKKSLQADGDS